MVFSIRIPDSLRCSRHLVFAVLASYPFGPSHAKSSKKVQNSSSFPIVWTFSHISQTDRSKKLPNFRFSGPSPQHLCRQVQITSGFTCFWTFSHSASDERSIILPVKWKLSSWYIDTEWLFHMQGGGMRCSGGYVDWQQRSRWKIWQVNVSAIWMITWQTGTTDQ